MKILLGPSGSPANPTTAGIRMIHELGLDAMEISFTHNVYMNNETARTAGETAKEAKVALSIHAPYYINLASDDESKVKGSRLRIMQSCERAHHLGAKKVVFHCAYYGKSGREEVFRKVVAQVASMKAEINEKKWDVELLPETMGRVAQFGDLDETIRLAKETGCSICVDPAHLYARAQGRIDFGEMFDKLRILRKSELHFHFSGINFGPRGEINHLAMGKPSFADFAKALLKRKTNATIISESPIRWKDSLNMKAALEEMGHKF